MNSAQQDVRVGEDVHLIDGLEGRVMLKIVESAKAGAVQIYLADVTVGTERFAASRRQRQIEIEETWNE